MGIFKSNKKEKRKYIVVGSKNFNIELNSDGSTKINRSLQDIQIDEMTHNRFDVLYKNRKHKAEIIEKKQNKYVVEINGNSYAFSIETPISFQRKKILEKKKGEDHTVTIQAPMPGKIMEVMVTVGAEVKEGDTLVILEAMKMQNEIIASRQGKVVEILVKAGDSVMKNDQLIVLE